MTPAQYKKVKRGKLIALTFNMLLLLALLVSLATIQPVSATRGAISIQFDDGLQTQYDYAFPLLQARGIKATFYVNTATINTPSFMTSSELLNLQNNGHEIDSHGNHHYDLPNLSEAQIRQELQVSQQTLRSWGLTANNFAYPDAARTAYTDSIVHDYYRSARWGYVGPFSIQLPTSLFLLPAQQGDFGNANDLPTIKALVDDAYNSNGWVNIVFHSVVPLGGTSKNTISSANFASFLDYIQAKSVTTITIDQCLNPTVPPTATPTPTLTPTQPPIATPTPTSSPTPTSIPTLTPTNEPTVVPTPIPVPADSPTPIPNPTDSPTLPPHFQLQPKRDTHSNFNLKRDTVTYYNSNSYSRSNNPYRYSFANANSNNEYNDLSNPALYNYFSNNGNWYKRWPFNKREYN